MWTKEDDSDIVTIELESTKLPHACTTTRYRCHKNSTSGMIFVAMTTEKAQNRLL